jgi:uncharacterized SAM-binding protein YcdF (DUF218 family)
MPLLVQAAITAAALAAAASWLAPRLRRRRSEAALAIGAFAAVLAGALAGRPERIAWPLLRVDAPAPVDAVFAFSGDVDFHRTLAAARIFRAQGARWFVVSGAGAGGDSGALMAKAAIDAGVPASAVIVEPDATTTRENVVLTAPLLPADVRRIAVVTSPLHSRRAADAAARAWPGVDVISQPTLGDPVDCDPETWRRDPKCRASVWLEWKKLAGYALRLWI